MTKLHKISPPASEAHVVGEEPSWNGFEEGSVTIDATNYKNQLGRALNWYNAVADKNDYPLNLAEWIAQFRPTTAKKELAIWKHNTTKAMKISGVSSTSALARMACRGFPLNDQHIKQITDLVDQFTKTKLKTEKVKEVEQVSVQDRMKRQLRPILSNLDVAIDDGFDGNPVDIEKLKVDALNPDYKAPHLTVIMQYLDHNIGEWTQAYNKTDEQLVEGYAYCPRKRLKQQIDMFTELRDALEKRASVVRVKKIMAKKPTDKKKLVSSLKYLKEFPELGLVSVQPIDVLGASVVWVYDTKRKKVGYYLGDSANSIFVKGTTILGTKECHQKALRKPKEQLAEFAKLRKNQIMNWFDAIRSKELGLKGRTNSNLIILRVDQ